MNSNVLAMHAATMLRNMQMTHDTLAQFFFNAKRSKVVAYHLGL